ncbi:hypothetical protein HGRIS_007864 [Hohenbuehelia grisea]|uniref:Uncharacterized protein n=1 Tax=Hohenbuehelia grisea TaxID=104357 RepID=A0ABR3J671_9AGAR
MFNLVHWYGIRAAVRNGLPQSSANHLLTVSSVGDLFSINAVQILQNGGPYPGDAPDVDNQDRFTIFQAECEYEIWDDVAQYVCCLPSHLLENQKFDLIGWYAKELRRKLLTIHSVMRYDLDGPHLELFWRNIDASPHEQQALAVENVMDQIAEDALLCERIRFAEDGDIYTVIKLNGQQIRQGMYPAIQRNAAVTKDFSCSIPKPVVVVVKIDGHLHAR